jgi:hypothetical protein
MCRTTFTLELILAPTIEDGRLFLAQDGNTFHFFVKLYSYHPFYVQQHSPGFNGVLYVNYDDVPESHRLSLYESNAEWGRDLFMFLRQHQLLNNGAFNTFSADSIFVSQNEGNLKAHMARYINTSAWTSLEHCPVLYDIENGGEMVEMTEGQRLGSSRGFPDDSPQYQGQSNTAKLNRAVYRIINHSSCHSFYIEEQRYKSFILDYARCFYFYIVKCEEE